MELNLQQLVFYLFALLTIGSAVIVVTIKNIVHAAFSLMVTLFSVAGLYVFLQADFLAATQVIVYVGRYSGTDFVRCYDDKWQLGPEAKTRTRTDVLGRCRIPNSLWLASECYYEYATMGKCGRRGIAGTDNSQDWRDDYERGVFAAI
ncbi:NAD(P)H-quinone oxidoreductase chain 6 [Geodia barretti]|uniref:NADH-ubiquinone oxidoreductase chain 6 n=1 Tax=Geodia barretti TaxID=519541 RepID=A0AA35TF92_GEOBA|nr:NAD(P)H-quinone oxidoreductase chain 6 [Geodia barretti]